MKPALKSGGWQGSGWRTCPVRVKPDQLRAQSLGPSYFSRLPSPPSHASRPCIISAHWGGFFHCPARLDRSFRSAHKNNLSTFLPHVCFSLFIWFLTPLEREGECTCTMLSHFHSSPCAPLLNTLYWTFCLSNISQEEPK